MNYLLFLAEVAEYTPTPPFLDTTDGKIAVASWVFALPFMLYFGKKEKVGMGVGLLIWILLPVIILIVIPLVPVWLMFVVFALIVVLSSIKVPPPPPDDQTGRYNGRN